MERGVARADNYEVTLNSDVVSTGAEAMLVFHITRGGQETISLEPYLGALGHLVVLRQGDLAYLHVHPVATGGTADASGSQITFHVRFPCMSRYRLFLQFIHEGQIHTATFTAEVSS
jgi:hypothetical protein